MSAPALREVPLTENPAAHELARRFAAGGIEMILFLTGVGTRALAAAIEQHLPRERFAAALAARITVARGPKPVAALRELGVTPTVSVPEPNTSREVLAAIDERFTIRGWTVAVQEYGEENPELEAEIAARGAEILRVPVYRWALPEDVGPLADAARRIASGALDVALFTSATQVDHLFRVASDDLAPGFARIAVGSIGPVTTRALERHGVGVDLEPEHPRMGQLVRAAAERARTVLAQKRG
ncbi:MAG: hypothetical protein QOD06_1321 [Candidatus Binatota bacterium]|nr:hypothetical protein [Candidatus Binatota bacterium]